MVRAYPHCLTQAGVGGQKRESLTLANGDFAELSLPHMFSNMMMALESMLTCVCCGDDASVGVFVRSSPCLVDKTRSSRSLAHTARPSATLLLNKRFLKPSAKQSVACHLALDHAKEDPDHLAIIFIAQCLDDIHSPGIHPLAPYLRCDLALLLFWRGRIRGRWHTSIMVE